jgi:hypothetical protein
LDGGARPVFLSLFPASNQLRHDESAAKEHDGAVEEDFQALVIAQMEARHSDIPAESHGSAPEQHKDAGNILRSSLAQSGLIVVRAHQRPPMEK